MPRQPIQDGVIIEFIQRGAYVKVTAVDVQTGTEASIVGTPNAGEETLKKLAIQKLAWVMNKRT